MPGEPAGACPAGGTRMIAVLVAAGGERAGARLESLVARPGRWQVTRAADGASLARLIADGRHDVALLDLSRRRVDQVLGRLTGVRERRPALVVLAGDVDRRWAAQAMRAGVRAVLPRNTSRWAILAAIEAVAAGLLVLHPSQAAGLAEHRHAGRAATEPLTTRETEVLAMMAEGLDNKRIAARLGMSRHTAKFHVASVLAKLGAASRTQAVTTGIRRGLVMV